MPHRKQLMPQTPLCQNAGGAGRQARRTKQRLHQSQLLRRRLRMSPSHQELLSHQPRMSQLLSHRRLSLPQSRGHGSDVLVKSRPPHRHHLRRSPKREQSELYHRHPQRRRLRLHAAKSALHWRSIVNARQRSSRNDEIGSATCSTVSWYKVNTPCLAAELPLPTQGTSSVCGPI